MKRITLQEHIQTVLGSLPNADMTVHFECKIATGIDGIINIASPNNINYTVIRFSVRKYAKKENHDKD